MERIIHDHTTKNCIESVPLTPKQVDAVGTWWQARSHGVLFQRSSSMQIYKNHGETSSIQNLFFCAPTKMAGAVNKIGNQNDTTPQTIKQNWQTKKCDVLCTSHDVGTRFSPILLDIIFSFVQQKSKNKVPSSHPKWSIIVFVKITRTSYHHGLPNLVIFFCKFET